MYVCIYIYIYIYMHRCTCILYIYTYMYICIYTYIYIYSFICIHVWSPLSTDPLTPPVNSMLSAVVIDNCVLLKAQPKEIVAVLGTCPQTVRTSALKTTVNFWSSYHRLNPNFYRASWDAQCVQTSSNITLLATPSGPLLLLLVVSPRPPFPSHPLTGFACSRLFMVYLG